MQLFRAALSKMKVFGEILFLFVAVKLYASNEIINGKL